MSRDFVSSPEKIVTADVLIQIVADRKAAGETVVFTNGVFDILHVGHARYLAEARELGDALVVAVNTDLSVRGIKGDLRPVVSELERAEMLGWLTCVDYVVFFGTPTPVPLIEQVKPDIYVKGGDYQIEKLPETPVVRSYGGEVKILSLIEGKSTTGIIEKIVKAYS